MRTPLAAVLACALALALVPPASAPAQSSLDAAVTRVINVVRTQRGVRPLRDDRALAQAARRHSRAMARSGVLTHAPSLASRLPRARTASTLGETIAWMPGGTPRLAREVVLAWLRSPPHRALLLSSAFRRIGVGSRAGRGGTFFTAEMAG